MRKILKKYYVQIIIYLIWINNQISTLWKGDKNHFVSWSGNLGYDMYWHAWSCFDHVGQIILWASALLISIYHPLEGECRKFAFGSVLLIILIIIIEKVRYFYNGSNDLNEYLFFTYISVYTISVIGIGFYHKAISWK